MISVICIALYVEYMQYYYETLINIDVNILRGIIQIEINPPNSRDKISLQHHTTYVMYSHEL